MAGPATNITTIAVTLKTLGKRSTFIYLMTIIICKVQSGMCNRLIPFITSYRLAMNLVLTFYLCWDDIFRKRG